MTPSGPAGSWGADRGTGTFDEVFRSENIRVIRTPVRAPRANAYAERCVGTLRRECLDWILILGRRHLESVVQEYLVHYNAHIGGSISTAMLRAFQDRINTRSAVATSASVGSTRWVDS